jgi:hypothetical protein
VGVTACGVSIAVNFGQLPFRFDLTSVIRRVKKSLYAAEPDRVGSDALSLNTELIAVLRVLMSSPTWRPHLQGIFCDAVAQLPQCLMSVTSSSATSSSVTTTEQRSDVLPLLYTFAALSVLGAENDEIYVRRCVRMTSETTLVGIPSSWHISDTSSNSGLVVDYVPQASALSVLFDTHDSPHHNTHSPTSQSLPSSLQRTRISTLQSVTSVRPLALVPVDVTWFDLMPRLLPTLTLVLQDRSPNSPFARCRRFLLYQRLKSRILKVLVLMFQNENATKAFLSQGLCRQIITALHDTSLTVLSSIFLQIFVCVSITVGSGCWCF